MSSIPSDVDVITEKEIYETSIRKAVGSDSPDSLSDSSVKDFSWSDVEKVEEMGAKIAANRIDLSKSGILPELAKPVEEPKVEEPKAEEKAEEQEEKQKEEKTEEKAEKEEKEETNAKPQENEVLLAQIKQLLAEIKTKAIPVENVKPADEEESDDDMPPLVDDTDDDMPALVDSSESEAEESETSETDDMMIAIFRRPSCPRCAAALKALLTHDEGSGMGDEFPEEHESESSEEADDSDSDYVPSETSSQDGSTADSETNSESCSESCSDVVSEPPSPRTLRHRTVEIPTAIIYTLVILIVLYVVKFRLLVTDNSRGYRRCTY